MTTEDFHLLLFLLLLLLTRMCETVETAVV